MAASASPFASSFTQVPLLIPAELRDSVLSSAAEIIVEHSTRSRCFLHIHNEEERVARLKALADNNDSTSLAERHAHEQQLEELREARAVLWRDPRIQRFVRYANPLVWPSHEHLSRVAAVAHQLILCDDQDKAASLQRANEITRAAQVVAREATHPGLHLLKESTLAGQALLYNVRQTRKRERFPGAPSMPSLLARADSETVGSTAWIAEVKQTSYAVSDVLQLPFAVPALTRLVELLQQRSSPAPSPSGAATPPASAAAALRQQWKGLLEQHRAWAEYQSLFADVAESCTAWGMTEACVARCVHAALESGSSVQLRTGVQASVVHRRELLLLLTTRPRKLDSITTGQQLAVAATLSPRTWSQCVEEGLVRLVQQQPQQPSSTTTLSALEPTIRRLFLSPSLSEVPLKDCCTVSDPVSVDGADLQLVKLTSSFNPFVVLHGSRVGQGFEGDVAYYHTLQRERDRIVDERTDEQLRLGYMDGASPRSAARAEAAAKPASLASPVSGRQQQQVSTAASMNDASGILFRRALISTLTAAPLSKAEIKQHPSMQQFRTDASFDAVLGAKLKEVAEFKGRKYQLRN